MILGTSLIEAIRGQELKAILTGWWKDVFFNIRDELNATGSSSSCEWKYLGDICTMKGVTVQKVFLKTFEGQGLSGLCAKFQLA